MERRGTIRRVLKRLIGPSKDELSRRRDTEEYHRHIESLEDRHAKKHPMNLETVGGHYAGNATDFFTATDVTKPFWEREAALDRMHPDQAAFWAKDVTLPSWVRNKYPDSRGRRR